MARKALPVFAWDQLTRSMQELTLAESKAFLLAHAPAGVAHFHALVADDDEEDRLLTIWKLGDEWSVAGRLMVEDAADGVAALKKIQNCSYALVVRDGDMPELHGEAACAKKNELDSGQFRKAINDSMQLQELPPSVSPNPDPNQS